MSTKSNRIFTILGILLVVLAIGYNVYTSAIFGQHGLDADSASEMVLANELNKEGKRTGITRRKSELSARFRFISWH